MVDVTAQGALGSGNDRRDEFVAVVEIAIPSVEARSVGGAADGGDEEEEEEWRKRGD